MTGSVAHDETEHHATTERHPMFRTPTLRGASTLALTIGALLACTGCAAQAPQQLDKSQESTFEQWQHEFDRCMQQEGIAPEDLAIPVSPDGSPAAPAADTADVDAALQTCSNKVGPAPDGTGTVVDDQLNEQLLAYAKCMRDAGYDVADPTTNDGGVTIQQQGVDADPADISRCTEQAGLQHLGN